MSDSGDQSKIDKKREYNRNAQRVFRQRRKEHLKSLEASERDRSVAQSEELDRLRRENEELRQENDSLQRFYGSQSTSPCPPPSSSGNQFSPLLDASLPSPLLTHSHPLPLPFSTMASPEPGLGTPGLCILVPHDMSQVRHYLQSLFHPILDPNLSLLPQQHLSTLAVLGPSLPSQLRPTESQLQTPHHVYIDLIPSPTLRNSLIAADPSTANMFLNQICTFACDDSIIEDRGQLVIWGEDFLNEFSWELSADVLEQWGGWLLPSIWGERANFWRTQRGAPVLPAWV